ncbi:phage/conjugal plasmid C-4 type zinc finger TraR family protein [Rahnella sp. BIGb0603]|uniref:TraR/DksA family transcriptional regulator n=1 Tax=Rahnella sp. BIGb0603 TaxID=2940612 RepID=UPI00216A08B0|nr:TraR/DksA family transcriptional regulator [Rahnella sp. BIGb0603]MCS3425894.1 phage/conjugal plasmid C-4 type zinc finger TraR family protein [Rahnella sp. BIGb0603]
MADVIDNAQERADLILAAQIYAARTPVAGISAMFCLDCDRPIPEERRAALPGVELCVYCKELAELNAKHYRGNQ